MTLLLLPLLAAWLHATAARELRMPKASVEGCGQGFSHFGALCSKQKATQHGILPYARGPEQLPVR